MLGLGPHTGPGLPSDWQTASPDLRLPWLWPVHPPKAPGRTTCLGVPFCACQSHHRAQGPDVASCSVPSWVCGVQGRPGLGLDAVSPVLLHCSQMTPSPTSARPQTNSSSRWWSGPRGSLTSPSCRWMTRSSCCGRVSGRVLAQRGRRQRDGGWEWHLGWGLGTSRGVGQDGVLSPVSCL